MPLTRRKVDDTAQLEIKLHRDAGHHLTDAEKRAIRKKHERIAGEVHAERQRRR